MANQGPPPPPIPVLRWSDAIPTFYHSQQIVEFVKKNNIPYNNRQAAHNELLRRFMESDNTDLEVLKNWLDAHGHEILNQYHGGRRIRKPRKHRTRRSRTRHRRTHRHR